MSKKLLEIFKEEISEQGRKQARQYSLPVMMYLSVIAILMGAKNPIEIHQWMKNNGKRKEIKKLLSVEFFKAPGKSRVYDFFEIVDKDELEKAFRKWIRIFIDIPEHSVAAVDGKVLRGSANAKDNAVSVLSVVLAETKLIIAHKEIAKKSNEIPVFQEFIGELDETFSYGFDALNTQKKTLKKASDSGSKFIAKVENNQKSLLALAKEIEEVSSIDSSFQMEIKQSNDFIQRNVYVYNNSIYPWDGIFIRSVIRVDKIVNCKETTTHYCVSNDIDNAESFLNKILQEWSVETMHFYKDTALQEDRCKINKGAFSFSILRSIVINILHLNKVQNIGRKIVDTTQNLAEALMLFSMVKLEYGIIKS